MSLTPNERLASLEAKVAELESEMLAVVRSLPWTINSALIGLRNERVITHLQLRSISEAVCKEVGEAFLKHDRLAKRAHSVSRDIADNNKTHR